MIDYIIIGVLVGAIGGSLRRIIKAKKRGDKCIGCPHSKSCGTDKKNACNDDNNKK